MNVARASRLMGCTVAGVLVAASVQAQIASVARGGGSENTEPAIAPSPLGEDVLTFVDRPHEYNEVPGALQGIQYVQVANDDKTVEDYSLEVVLDRDAVVYLFIDRRVGDDDETNPPSLGGGTMDWVLDLGFSRTGQAIGIDEGGDGEVDQRSTVYRQFFPAGTTLFLEQNDGGSRNMYGVAAQAVDASPLPAASSWGLALLAVSLLAGGAFLVRRRAASAA